MAAIPTCGLIHPNPNIYWVVNAGDNQTISDECSSLISGIISRHKGKISHPCLTRAGSSGRRAEMDC